MGRPPMRCFSVSLFQELHGHKGLSVLVVNFVDRSELPVRDLGVGSVARYTDIEAVNPRTISAEHPCAIT